MKIQNLIRVFGISLVALTVVLGAAGISYAQYDRDRQNNNQQNRGYRIRHKNFNRLSTKATVRASSSASRTATAGARATGSEITSIVRVIWATTATSIAANISTTFSRGSSGATTTAGIAATDTGPGTPCLETFSTYC